MFFFESNELKSAMFAKGIKVETELKLWHKRIGHINFQKLKGMQSKGVIIGLLTFTEKEIIGVSEACQFGKQHRQPFPEERNVNKGILDVVDLDVCGPTQIGTFSGCRYYVSLIDDFSRHVWIHPMRQKSEAIEHFQWFKNEVEKATSRHVRCL